ncbi:unnamed protein product [Symbiodinium sp. CCMP2592]|nr:unnamed protein product [Symbiodinium sp. CCMP2592]
MYVQIIKACIVIMIVHLVCTWGICNHSSDFAFRGVPVHSGALAVSFLQELCWGSLRLGSGSTLSSFSWLDPSDLDLTDMVAIATTAGDLHACCVSTAMLPIPGRRAAVIPESDSEHVHR